MRKTANYMFLRHEQPNAFAWSQIGEFAAHWNERSTNKFSESMGFLWTIKFPDQTDPIFTEFLRELATHQSDYGFKYHVDSEKVLDKDDYNSADFVEILGISLEGQSGGPFILNEANSLGEPIPCPECGWFDIFSAPQKKPFEIDERHLVGTHPQGGENPTGGWDCVNLPNGHKLVSQRFIDVLRRGDVRGYELLPVNVVGTNEVSNRMFQMLAHKAILFWRSPYPQDIWVTFCSTCGAARSFPPGTETAVLQPAIEYCVDKDEIDGDEVFSHHAGRGAMLYFAQRVYQLLLQSRLNGIVANETINVCKEK